MKKTARSRGGGRMNNDLISREALKKAFYDECILNCYYCKHFKQGDNSHSKCELIDNAPTVAGPKYILKVKNLTAEDKKRFREEWNKSAGGLLAIPDNYEIIPIERPLGEWGEWVISEIRCPNCLEYFQTDCYSTEELNKCPNCGAQMRGGGANE